MNGPTLYRRCWSLSSWSHLTAALVASVGWFLAPAAARDSWSLMANGCFCAAVFVRYLMEPKP